MKRIAFIITCVLTVGVMNSCSFIKHEFSAAYHRNISSAPFDVVIVPGTPFDSARPNPVYVGRMLWAKSLFEKGIVRNIIFSGAAVHSPFVEGEVMKITADSLGIPPQHTFAENRAEHSTENLIYSIEMAHAMGYRKIAVATDPFQSFYLGRYIRKQKLDVAMLPFSIDSMPIYYHCTLPSIDFASAHVANFVPLEKREVAMNK